MKRIVLGMAALCAAGALAADAPATADSVQTNLNVVWTLIAGILVFTDS